MTALHPDTRAAIIAMCRYITSDSTIAAYTKVSLETVARLRKQVWRNGRAGYNARIGPSLVQKDDGHTYGLQQEQQFRADCKDSSERLLKALWKHHPRIMTVLGAVQ